MKLTPLDAPGYEKVVYAEDEASGLKSIIAVHSTKLGPAAGGCRMFAYPDFESAKIDALRLSKGMTYKNAAASLPLGGGKSVIIADPKTQKTPELMQAFGRFVESFEGMYTTAEDVGISVEDIEEAAKYTSHAAGLNKGAFASGDPSPVTARGVYLSCVAAAKHAFGHGDLEGKIIALQGLGHVGMYLAEHLHAAGAQLIVSDINASSVAKARQAFSARSVAPNDIYDVEADIFAPCAMGAILNADTISRLKVKLVCGAANNQLADDAAGDALMARGILYAPDYVVNGGGIISVSTEILKITDEKWVDQKLEQLAVTTDKILTKAKAQNASPHKVADQFVDEILAQ
ncbi:Leu/Phe/Val dehydrogenase [Maritalea myrionectae]|uniref:Leu/Phe/Val dehydrogenase n=1 Tax=Maritalea myrionectae TaxID=454601 RepID=UPI00041627A6|nr:Glu/Leu/Phe/Val dehydrogenase dimerization domain-containing protein [Maritalea myrionectae]